jgi:two-component system sensor histidine kinase VicK
LTIEIESIKKALLNAKSRGIKLRYITEITRDNISYCIEMIKIVDELHHLDGIKGNFYISETEYIAPATFHEKGRPASQIIYSNVIELVGHQQYVFETLWNKSIPSEQKIRQIEEGVELEGIEIIQNTLRTQEIYLNLVKDATKEIMFIFPTINAFVRQQKLGIIQLLKKAAKQYNVKIRILMPINKLIEKDLYDLKQQDNITVRLIGQISDTQATFLIVDRKASLVIEIKDDTKTTFAEAIGLSTYSNSKAGVLSYVAIFETMWKQTELYQQIKESNEQLELAIEQLKVHDKMQKEFINIAAHELRTPIMPIIGYAEMLESDQAVDKKDAIVSIIRNAKRLERLADSILDVTRIESQSLKLHKEKIKIDDVIMDAIQDYRDEIEKKCNGNLKLLYEPSNKEDIIVEADRGRLTQVISNLLSNALKFTKEGVISINTVKKEENEKDILIVSIKDTGSGIDAEIFQKLFSRFISRSFSGTGLGLFISKNIVEAHEGKIWAENNSDGKGATFYFSLPLIINQKQLN